MKQWIQDNQNNQDNHVILLRLLRTPKRCRAKNRPRFWLSDQIFCFHLVAGPNLVGIKGKQETTPINPQQESNHFLEPKIQKFEL